MKVYDLAVIQARLAVAQDDDRACVAAYDRLVARYGQEEASRAWRIACTEADLEAERMI